MVLRGAACSLPPAIGDVLVWIGRYLPRRTVATSYNLNVQPCEFDGRMQDTRRLAPFTVNLFDGG